MKAIILSIFIGLSCTGLSQPAEKVAASAVAPGLDTDKIAEISIRATDRELRRLTSKVSSSWGHDQRVAFLSKDIKVLEKLRLALSSSRALVPEADRVVLDLPAKQLSADERTKLVNVYLMRRTQETTNLLTKLTYANDEIRDFMAQASQKEVDQAVDTFQQPESVASRKLMARIARGDEGAESRLRRQVEGARHNLHPVLAGFGMMPSLETNGAPAKRNTATKE